MRGRFHLAVDDIQHVAAGGAAPSHHPELRRPRRRPDAGDHSAGDHQGRNRPGFRRVGDRMAVRPAAGPGVSGEARTAHHPLAEVVSPDWWAATTCRASPGAGQEFLDHRNFHHGDDLRAVNWRAYLRLEKLFLKMFQVEPRVPVRLLLDLSASMAAHGGAEVRLRAEAGGRAVLRRPGAAGQHRGPRLLQPPDAAHLLHRRAATASRA